MISPPPCSNNHAVVLEGAHISPAIRTDHDSDSDRVMDPDEQRDYADQGPPSDSDLDGDTQILATLLKLIPGRIDAADIELLLQGIPVQPPLVMVYAGGNTGRRHATTGRGCCQHLLQERTHSSGARASTRYQCNCSERPYTKGPSPSRFQ